MFAVLLCRPFGRLLQGRSRFGLGQRTRHRQLLGLCLGIPSGMDPCSRVGLFRAAVGPCLSLKLRSLTLSLRLKRAFHSGVFGLPCRRNCREGSQLHPWVQQFLALCQGLSHANRIVRPESRTRSPSALSLSVHSKL